MGTQGNVVSFQLRNPYYNYLRVLVQKVFQQISPVSQLHHTIVMGYQ